MKPLLKAILIIGITNSCHSNTEQTTRIDPTERLVINNTGDGDVLQFKMFEGLSLVLKQDSVSGEFKGVLEIPNLNEAIFTYGIMVHRKDSLGRMIELEPNKTLFKLNQNEAIEKGDRFLWIGKNRNGSYSENEERTGSLITKGVQSEFLEDEREITVYSPKKVSSKIPHIYFTDGSIVKSYALYNGYHLYLKCIHIFDDKILSNSSSDRLAFDFYRV